MSGSSVESHLEALQAQIQAVQVELEALRAQPRRVTSAEELEALERAVVELTDRLAGLSIALQIQSSVAAEGLQREASELAKRCPRKLRHHGLREVVVRPLRGEAVGVQVAYYRAGGRTRRRRVRGLYPATWRSSRSGPPRPCGWWPTGRTGSGAGCRRCCARWG